MNIYFKGRAAEIGARAFFFATAQMINATAHNATSKITTASQIGRPKIV